MNKDITNFVLFIGICFIGYVFFIRTNFTEGMKKMKPTAQTTSDETMSLNGIAGNAATYAADLKSASVKLSDTFLVSKYRTDYENAILNADELVNNMMLETTLSLNPSDPIEGINKLVALNSAKAALNEVMKFVDSG